MACDVCVTSLCGAHCAPNAWPEKKGALLFAVWSNRFTLDLFWWIFAVVVVGSNWKSLICFHSLGRYRHYFFQLRAPCMFCIHIICIDMFVGLLFLGRTGKMYYKWCNKAMFSARVCLWVHVFLEWVTSPLVMSHDNATWNTAERKNMPRLYRCERSLPFRHLDRTRHFKSLCRVMKQNGVI